VGGRDAVLEVYVPVDVPGTTRHAAVVLLPLVLAGLALLAVAMIPLSVSLARRMERDRAEQRAVRHYGLAAAELARRDLAQKLHDGVIPDLAGAGLLLEAIRARGHDGADTVPWQLLDHAHDLVTGEVRQLRTLLTELLPPDPVGADLAAALGDLVHRARAGAALAGPLATEPAVHVEVEGTGAPALSDDTAVLLHRVAGELLRNAFRHAGADTVTVRVAAGAAGFVELTVADDGVGFAPDQRRRHGHIGLLLVQRVVEDGGGRVVVTTGPGAGTTVTVTVPSVGGFPRPVPGMRP
jgi:two-component system, NarL family, sensor kinase